MTRRGLTLIELLITLGLMAGMMLVLGNIFISASHFGSNEEQRIEVGEAAARSLANLDELLRQGRSILASTSINGTTFTTNETTLVMTVPSLVNGGPTATDDIVVLSRNANTGVLEERMAPYTDPNNSSLNSLRSAGTSTLATDIIDLYLRYPNESPTQSTGVTVIVNTNQSVLGRPFTRTIMLTQQFRNHG